MSTSTKDTPIELRTRAEVCRIVGVPDSLLRRVMTREGIRPDAIAAGGRLQLFAEPSLRTIAAKLRTV